MLPMGTQLSESRGNRSVFHPYMVRSLYASGNIEIGESVKTIPVFQFEALCGIPECPVHTWPENAKRIFHLLKDSGIEVYPIHHHPMCYFNVDENNASVARLMVYVDPF